MPDVFKTIDDLPAALGPDATGFIWVMVGGSSYKLTIDQLRDWLANGQFASPVITTAIIARDAAGTYRGLFIDNATGIAKGRWAFLADNAAEAGSNAGSDLLIPAFDDSGTLIGTFLKGIRATLEAQFGGMVKFIAGTTTKASRHTAPGAAKTSGLADGDEWMVNASGWGGRRNGVSVTWLDTSNRPDGSQALAQAGSDGTFRTWTAANLKDALVAMTLGQGQTWQDMQASREFATNYQNLTARPIAVSVMYHGTAGGSTMAYGLEISANGSTGWVVIDRSPALASSTITYSPLQGIIPPNYYYRLTRTDGTGTTKALWAELR